WPRPQWRRDGPGTDARLGGPARGYRKRSPGWTGQPDAQGARRDRRPGARCPASRLRLGLLADLPVRGLRVSGRDRPTGIAAERANTQARRLTGDLERDSKAGSDPGLFY